MIMKPIRCLFVEFHPSTDRANKIQALRTFIAGEGLTVVKERLRAFTAVR